MPQLGEERVLRLALDINIFIADILTRRHGRHGGAAVMLVDAVRDGICAAGPVQLVTSLPIIENYANLLRRNFGYSASEADEKAWLLEQYTIEGPMPDRPSISVGSGYIPFETETELRQAIASFAAPKNAGKLFHEIQDDRYILETALAGRADILATADIDDFIRADAIEFNRKDVVLFPFAGRTLVIAKPSFVAYWLNRGVIPDAAFIATRPDEFPGRAQSLLGASRGKTDEMDING